ncbi:Nn.00g079620.m01.CDS01 [Neocucurbitaria sp. VM-36]
MPPFKDSISSTPAGPSGAPTPASTVPTTSTNETLHGASAALTSQGLDLCPHCFREMSHCNERFEFA